MLNIMIVDNSRFDEIQFTSKALMDVIIVNNNGIYKVVKNRFSIQERSLYAYEVLPFIKEMEHLSVDLIFGKSS